MITITKEEYIALRMAQEKLRLLDAGGVDNWMWYTDSLYPKGEETIADYMLFIDGEAEEMNND